MLKHKNIRDGVVFVSVTFVMIHLAMLLVGTQTAEIVSWIFSSLYALFLLGALLYLYISDRTPVQEIHMSEKEKMLPSILDEYEKKEGSFTESDIKFILHRMFPDSKLSHQVVEEVLDMWVNE